MSFKLYNPQGQMLAEFNQGDRAELSLPRSYVIEPVSFAFINHGLTIGIDEGSVIVLISAPDVMEIHGLLIGQSALMDKHSVRTPVFNLSDRRAHIDRSEVLSWLVEL